MMLGEIKGLRNGKEAVAIINQIRTIDKRRLFDASIIANLRRYFAEESIKEYDEIPCQSKRLYRLTKEQFEKVHTAIKQYVFNGYIKHS